MSELRKDYYVYALCDPRYDFDCDGLNHKPFYIGKGTGKRAQTHLKEAAGLRKPQAKYALRLNYFAEMASNNVFPVLVYIKTDLIEADAYNLEVLLIRKYGRLRLDEGGILINRTIDSRIEHKSFSNKGVTRPPRTAEHAAANTASRLLTYREHSQETRAKMSARKMGKKQSPIHIENRVGHLKGGRNPNALAWTVITPNGETFEVQGLRSWCRENEFSVRSVYNSRNGFTTIRHGKGKGGGRHRA